jgi:ATP-binding cassette subfamily B protein/subfamily B ATP-binding cassette protein MsbA
MLLLVPFRLLVSRWINQSPSRQLLAESAWVHKYQLLVVFLLGSASAILEGLTFALLGVALELLATNGSLTQERLAPWGLSWLATWSTSRQFIVLVLSAVTCQVLKSVFQVANTQITTLLSTAAAQAVQQKVLGTILGMSFGSASRYKVGELTNFVVTPAESVAQVLVQLLAWTTNLLTVLAYVVVLCGISLPLFIASLFLFGAVVWLQKVVSRKIGALSYLLGMQQADLSRKVVEGISALRLVHAFQRQDLIREQVTTLQEAFIQTLRKLNVRLAMLGPLSESLLLIGLGGFLLFGFFLFKDNRTTLLPDLLTFIAVLNRLSSRVSQIGIGWSNVRQFASRVSVLNDLLSTGSKLFQRQGGIPLASIGPGISFEGISLRYNGRDDYALRGISLFLPKGTSLALVGPSGSGKSSLADLLLGLYEPTEGRVVIDGTDLRAINISTWRDKLGVVSQDTLLFNASVKENLLFALPEATDAQIMEALQGADAWSFISSLPQGIDTLVGERGFMLSGGQRQRLAIARALLRQPAVLILDEATSALDTNAEQAVQATLDSIVSSGTRLIIAHRLSTIKNADQIVVLDHGRIVESGSHSELLDRNGLYATLWLKQSGGSEPATVNPARLISPVR